MLDSSVHAATLHYSLARDPFTLYMTTSNSGRKAEAFGIPGEKVKASVVVGTSWEEWVTVQMDGDAWLVEDPAELAIAKEIHYARNPDSKARNREPHTIMIAFRPTWWLYSNYQEDPPARIGSKS
jgi:hypothetical protein